MRGGVGGAGDHTVGTPGVDQHRAEVRHVAHSFLRLLEVDTLVLAQLGVDVRELVGER